MSDLRAQLQALLGDRYIIESEVGQGGMAIVFLARELKHDRAVAIKVLRPQVATALGPERFLTEIRLTAKLDHPHILTLIDSGRGDGLLYYVLPFIRGESLRHRLEKQKQLSIEETVRIGCQVASALDYAHRQGVIHRDIKPENVLLHEGEAMVADFGVALGPRESGGERLTESGMAIGTPAYMSPEQASGEHEIDGRADIYALACVVYEMLAGEPPYTGRTPQAIRARQLLERPPSLQVVRTTVPTALQQAVERGLARVPADRFATAGEFAEAMVKADGRANTAGAEGVSRARFTPRYTMAVLAVLLLGAVGGWLLLDRNPPSDPNKVVVYPFSAPRQDAELGEDVALMIASALEHTEPLRWLDGQVLLGPDGNTDARLLGSKAGRAARRAGARYYVDGAVVKQGDSLTVIVRLHDAMADSLVQQESASGGASVTAPKLALRAIGRLLPRLLPPNGRVDLSYLTDRNAAAIADWLQGEREYSHSQYIAAMDHMNRALAKDSAMGVAALKGAQAAANLEDYATAKRLIDIALQLDRQLPRHHLALAHGLEHYLAGEADSAVADFRVAQALDTTWSEPWMWLGESYYHLMPSVSGLDSLAEAAFGRAVRLNPSFAPALFHLAESAARRGDRKRASELLTAFQEVSPDSDWTFQLQLVVRCAAEGPDRINWPAAVARASDRVVNVARMLGGGARYPACSRRALEAVLANDTVSGSDHVTYRWSALKGLDYQTMAEGHTERVVTLLDSALAHGMPAAAALDVPNVIAGAPAMAARAESTVALLVKPFREMSAVRLWYFALWEGYRGDRALLDSVVKASSIIADSSGAASDRLVAEGAAARLALLRGDTTAAIRQLRALRPAGEVGTLAWDPWQSAAAERLLLAELLLATKDYSGAIEVAEVFDSPRSQINLLFLPASLRIRMLAADGLRQMSRRDGYRSRLKALGRLDLL